METLGLSRREIQRYSILRAIQAVARNDHSNAGLEMEASRAECLRRSITLSSPHTFLVPNDVFVRDMTAATSTAGGYLVGTDQAGFIELLRPRSVVMSLGAQVMDGLVGNVTIPRQTGSATGYWLSSESAVTTESQMTLGQVAMTPKTVASYTEVSRQLMLQSSPSAERLVRSDLAKVVAQAVDTAALSGTGLNGQPTGLLNTSGVGSVTAAPLTYQPLVECQTDVATANALSGACAYVTTPAVAGLLKGRQRFANTDTPLWQGSILRGEIEGFAAMTSTVMPADTLVFGDWEQIIIGEWGQLALDVNPYASFASGIIGVRAMYTVDVAVRHAGAFSVAAGVT